MHRSNRSTNCTVQSVGERLLLGRVLFVVFFFLRKAGALRVDDGVIAGEGGLDKHEHGEYAYVLDPHLSRSPAVSMADLSAAELGAPATKSSGMHTAVF